MGRSIQTAITLSLLSALTGAAVAAEPAPPQIAWYGTLDSALAEARRSQRPLMFVSAAPQCLGVSGIW